VQAAARFGPTRQGHVQRLFGQACFQRRLADAFAAVAERRLDEFLGPVDRGAGGLLLLRRQFAQALEQFGDPAALARKRALTCSSASGSEVAANAARAWLTI
jgi:hypothetical protein